MADITVLRQCRKCKQIKPSNEFHRKRASNSGYHERCKICRLNYMFNYLRTEKGKATKKAWRIKYKNTECGREMTKLSHQRWWKTDKGKIARKKADRLQYMKNNLRCKARIAVNNAVKRGNLPNIKTLSCHYCGTRASERHHYLGYKKEHWFSVITLCRPCHLAAAS